MRKTIKILIIEDEPMIMEFLCVGLRYEGYKIISATTGKSGLLLAQKDKKISLIILDIILPDIDGFEVCRQIRANGINAPILMLTVKKDISDRVKGLDIGADDYMTKPFSFEELLARIRALLRRSGTSIEQTKLISGDITLDIETREVTKEGKNIQLTPTEFALLELFMKYPRRVFTRETLLNRILGYNYMGESNIIDVHISHLRNKIGDRPPKLIKTIYGVGYAFYPDKKNNDME